MTFISRTHDIIQIAGCRIIAVLSRHQRALSETGAIRWAQIFQSGHRMNNTGNDLGLIYMNARYYMPEVGRFIIS